MTVTLVVAAVIDGYKLKVPNWITFPLVLSGWVYGAVTGGWAGFGDSLLGTGVGLALLLPAYAIGGMGAGDVKLLAGVGAWVGAQTTFYAFCVSAVVGGVIALAMVLVRAELAQTQKSIPGHRAGDCHDRQSAGTVGHRGRTQKFHAAIALRHSDRNRHYRLFRMDRNVDMNRLVSNQRRVLRLGDILRQGPTGHISCTGPFQIGEVPPHLPKLPKRGCCR